MRHIRRGHVLSLRCSNGSIGPSLPGIRMDADFIDARARGRWSVCGFQLAVGMPEVKTVLVNHLFNRGTDTSVAKQNHGVEYRPASPSSPAVAKDGAPGSHAELRNSTRPGARTFPRVSSC